MAMTDQRSGLLLVLVQPPATLEEEFNAWYDTEHIPERAAVPGFRSALRYVCLAGYPRYMAIYDLDHVSVLDSPAYLGVSGANFSPWTKRVTSRVQVCRIVAEQVHPGGTSTGRSARLLLVRLRAGDGTDEATVVDGFRRSLESAPGASTLRVFAGRDPLGDFYCCVEMNPPFFETPSFAALGPLARRIDLINVYTPYAVGAAASQGRAGSE
jgi:hypothetical protein